MTYDEAVTGLKAMRDAGQRDVQVSPEWYAAYCSGLKAMTRLNASPREIGEYDWVWFKDVKVRKGVENIGLVAFPYPPQEDFEFPPCE